jgi:outer membrane receptor protein involved in Fe transport
MDARATCLRSVLRTATTVAFGALLPPTWALAQQSGTVRGRVTRIEEGSPISGVSVTIRGTGIGGITGPDGTYYLERVPVGQQTVLFRWLGYEPEQTLVTVTPDAATTVDIALRAQPVALREVVVTASRVPERVVDAPAAVAIAGLPQIRAAAATGQLPRVVENLPGVDLVQSGMSDFNLNTRGFNSSLNRRVLVLQDGRDMSVALLGAQEWDANSPLEDGARVELVRGPGSALYGANAFSGVLSVTTPAAREIAGSRLTLTGGELNSFKADARQAGVFSQGRLGYKIEGGYSTSDTWSRSRTLTNGTDFIAEYRAATTDTTTVNLPSFGHERRPLSGQTISDTTTGTITGSRDPIVAMFGTGRLDYYAAGGAVGTVEGGAAQVENELFITGIGRVQVTEALRPWARATWADRHYNLEAWYSGRNSIDPQYSLASGLPIEEHSAVFHVEGQFNQAFLQDRLHVVAGASFRSTHVNTDTTLMTALDDNRTDQYYSGYGQVEYIPTPQLHLVGAARWDDGNLFLARFSPKAAVVFSPSQNHSLRVTFNQAFQTPAYTEFFLRVPVASPSASPAFLEQNLEGFFQLVKAQLGAGVADLNLPSNLQWNFSPMTQALALGNRNLKVEQVTGWELGYKGEFSRRGYVTIDGYINDLKNFVTDLLPGVNSEYPSFSLTDSVDVPSKLSALNTRVQQLQAGNLITAAQATALRQNIAALQAGYGQLAVQAPLLATIGGGERAFVVSYTNAGHVTERGIELGAGYYVTNEIKLEGTYTFFDFTVKDSLVGSKLVPNTPKHKGTFTASYAGPEGIEAAVTCRAVNAYDWASGVYAGPIPASQTVDVSLGYRVNNYVRAFAVGTNVLDQQRYSIYGGSVNGRRVVGGITATF